MLFSIVQYGYACINKEINIGVVDTIEGKLYSELIATLILERTGVKVGRYYYKTVDELEKAVVEQKVEMILLNTSEALHQLGLQVGKTAREDYETVKAAYDEHKGMIWLRPFDFTTGDGFTAPVISQSILDKFPAMPRIIDKLSSKLDEETRTRLIAQVQSMKTRRVAKDFLYENRLI